MMKILNLLVILTIFWNNVSHGQEIPSWTLREKIGQLIMVPLYPRRGPTHWKQVGQLIRDYNIGGVIVMQGTIEQAYYALDTIRKYARYPLMIAIDAEWGLSMRLKDGPSIPYAMTLGAIQDTSIVRELGYWTGLQVKMMGIGWNFAPVVDVNTNPANPVIHWRAFSSNPERVVRQAFAFMQGMKQAGISFTLKHFPGHGDTHQDSHVLLPVVNASASEMEQIHLLPYKKLLKYSPGVMVAHILVPSLDIKQLPASLSPVAIWRILRKQMNYKGIVFTDALNMKAVERWGAATGELALKAGATILLFPTNVDAMVSHIEQVVQKEKLSEEVINARVSEVIFWKQTNRFTPASLDSIKKAFGSLKWKALVRKAISHAQTLVKDSLKALPLSPSKQYKWIIISNELPLQAIKTLKLYHQEKIKIYRWDDLPAINDIDRSTWILIFPPSLNAKRFFGLDSLQIKKLGELAKIAGGTVLFTSPYFIPFVKDAPAIVVSYQQDRDFQDIAIQALFGSRGFYGVLPFEVGKWKVGHGIKKNPVRLGFGLLEEVGFNRKVFDSIDAFINYAIRQGSMPGARLLVAKNNLIVYDKAYGYLTYDSLIPVSHNTLYDLASVTKIAATTLAVMKLVDEGKLRLDVPIKWYLPELKNSDIGNITIREMLTHTAGLKAWIPFFKKITPDSLEMYLCSSEEADSFFCIPISGTLVASADIKDSVWNWIMQEPLKRRGKYRYSDLGFYITQKIIEKITHTPLDSFVYKNLYEPLGLQDITFNPLGKYPKVQIAPTEVDTYFRNEIIWGKVHDPGAALMGGVAGHAGLFATPYPLAELMQMLINGGTYAGIHLLSSETIKEFTSKATARYRRGIGFDKPDFKNPNRSPTCTEVPKSTFGHLGFTGTAMWADPDNQIIYILLANRTYPSMENGLFNQLSIRTNVHCLIYQALEKQ